MTNTELMRKFFHNLPERLAQDGITEEMVNSWSDEDYAYFVRGLHMEYPTPELQAQFEENKRSWLLAIKFRSSRSSLCFL